jgi:hypothetical protein
MRTAKPASCRERGTEHNAIPSGPNAKRFGRYGALLPLFRLVGVLCIAGCLRPLFRTSFHHQPEAQHPKSSAIHKIAGRLPHLWVASSAASKCIFLPRKIPFCGLPLPRNHFLKSASCLWWAQRFNLARGALNYFISMGLRFQASLG